MNKMLEINSCIACRFRDTNYTHSWCTNVRVNEKTIPNIGKIPNWCPLPDYPETVLPLPKENKS